MFGLFGKTVSAPPPSRWPHTPISGTLGSPPKGTWPEPEPKPPLVVKVEIEWPQPTAAMIDGAVAAMVCQDGFLGELFDQSELRDIARAALAGAREAARG